MVKHKWFKVKTINCLELFRCAKKAHINDNSFSFKFITCFVGINFQTFFLLLIMMMTCFHFNLSNFSVFTLEKGENLFFFKLASIELTLWQHFIQSFCNRYFCASFHFNCINHLIDWIFFSIWLSLSFLIDFLFTFHSCHPHLHLELILTHHHEPDASVKLLLPPGLREDEITKYPLLINVYGGPGTQQVTSRFDIGWGHYLASRRRIIYGMIDGRGSGNNGVNLMYEVYRRLGTVEIDDQIAVTR